MFKKPLWQTVWTQFCSRSTLFASMLNSSVILGNYLQQTTSADDIFRCFFLGALRVKSYISQFVYARRVDYLSIGSFAGSETPETIRGGLDLAVLFTPSTPNRQNRNQVRWIICAGVRRSTPSSEVVKTEQSRDLFQNKMAEPCLHMRKYLYRLIYSGVLQSAQFYLF